MSFVANENLSAFATFCCHGSVVPSSEQPLSLSVFYDIDGFSEGRSLFILQDIPQFGLVGYFLTIRFGLCITGSRVAEVMLSSLHYVLSGGTFC